MKKNALRGLGLLCLLLSFGAHAQPTFAPAGAEWWYGGDNWNYDYFHTTGDKQWADHAWSAGDTVVSGVACRKLQVDRYARQPLGNTYLDVQHTYYLYDNTDTVFFYNEAFGRFTPLYVFNAQEGDTVCIPTPNFGSTVNSDSTFCFIIDSIRTELYDTTHLRSFYTRHLGPLSYNWGTVWGGEYVGRYTEMIGGNFGKTTGLFPYYFNPDIIEVGLPSGEFRCYNDPAHHIKMVSYACDSVPEHTLGIKDAPAAVYGISVSPNPSSDGHFKISLKNPLNSNLYVRITDLSGRVIYKTMLSAGTRVADIRPGAHASGLYLIEFRNGQDRFYQKISVNP